MPSRVMCLKHRMYPGMSACSVCRPDHTVRNFVAREFCLRGIGAWLCRHEELHLNAEARS
jgi:hypothetical protein